MEKAKKIRLLTEKDVELRVKQTWENKNGVFALLLVYKEARTDMNILDETFGPMNWKRNHKLVGNTMYCSISVWDEEKRQWVEKEDAGKESNSESEKGQASDSFKRSGVNWGIGRELYNAPKIIIKLNEGEYKKDGNKITTHKNFTVQSMKYDEKEAIYTVFTIVDDSGTKRFSLDDNANNKPVTNQQPTSPTKENVGAICCGCGTHITDERVVQYSVRFYRQPLCRDCQKTAQKAA